MKLQPAIARLCKNATIEEYKGIKVCKTLIAVEDNFTYITTFGNTAEYLSKYSRKGGRVFLKDWELKIKNLEDKKVYDFTVKSLDVIDYSKNEEE